MSAPVRIPSACILAAVAGPMPWNFPTGRFSTKAGPAFGVMTNRPSGFFSPDAILARNLL